MSGRHAGALWRGVWWRGASSLTLPARCAREQGAGRQHGLPAITPITGDPSAQRLSGLPARLQALFPRTISPASQMMTQPCRSGARTRTCAGLQQQATGRGERRHAGAGRSRSAGAPGAGARARLRQDVGDVQVLHLIPRALRSPVHMRAVGAAPRRAVVHQVGHQVVLAGRACAREGS